MVERMQRVLVLGFSVVLRKLLAELQRRAIPGVEIDGFALGGHHYIHVVEYLDRALNRADYDLVVLDLVSSDCRSWTRPVYFEAHVATILHKIGLRGAKAAFVHFWRPDVTAEADPLRQVCDRLAAGTGIPVLDFGLSFVPGGEDQREGWFSEGFHFTSLGAAWAADIMQRDLLQPGFWAGGQDLVSIQPDPALMRRVTLDAADLGVVGRREMFTAGGVRTDVSLHGEGEEVILTLPQGFYGTGVYFCIGPRSGQVEVTIAGQAPVVLTLYDERCYYPRLKAQSLKIGGASEVRLRQLPGRPEVALLKGEADEGPRLLQWAWVAGARRA